MSFTITRLANQQALIAGTDKFGTEGKTVVSTARFDEVNRELSVLDAQDSFDNKVESFFAPLVEAVDELRKAAAAVPVNDPASYVTVRTGTEGTVGEQGLTLYFDADGTVLNLIENGDHSRLVWMGDRLLVTEYVPSKEDGPTLEEAQAVAEEILGAKTLPDDEPVSEEVPVNGAGIPEDADPS